MQLHINSMAGHQQGTVLVTSLLFLLIMTILGVSAMNTNVLEEKMVGNLRYQQIAFQAADSCNSQILTDPDNFTFNDTEEAAGTGNVGDAAAENAATYAATRRFHMYATPPRSSGYSAVKFQAAHNEFTCTGAGTSNAQTVLRQGVYQITPLL